MSNIDVSIMITAIDRPELHKSTIPKYLEYVNISNCKWNITINSVFGKEAETKEYFNHVLSNENVEIKVFNTGGSRKDWYYSVKHIINVSFNDNPNLAYLWLEDDWLLNSNIKLSDDLNLVTEENSYASLARRTAVSFNPGLWSKETFKNLMYTSINDPENSIGKMHFSKNDNLINPERICCAHPQATNTISVFKTVNRFDDLGREWQRTKTHTRSFLFNDKLL